MRRTHHVTRWALVSGRQVAAAALFALQLLIAVSPLVERQTPIRPTAHAHDQQTHHLLAHDESTCGVCAARTQVAVEPALPAVLVVVTTPLPMARSDRALAPAGAPRSANPSRAPPVLS
jgi:hypothetical protein